MGALKPTVTAENAHYLKGHASWLYCDKCGKTIAYLCYVTYAYFSFAFHCACGCTGAVENKYTDMDPDDLPLGELEINPVNKRYCCPHDQSALFSPVPRHLKSYRAKVVCRQCNTRFEKEEQYTHP